MVGNVDETPWWVEPIGAYTVDQRGAISVAVRTGKGKERVIAVPTCLLMARSYPRSSHFGGKEIPCRQEHYQGQIEHPEQAGRPPRKPFSVTAETYMYDEEMTGVWKQSVMDYMRQQRCIT